MGISAATALVLVLSAGLRGGGRVLMFIVPALELLVVAILFARARPKMQVIVPLFACALFAMTVACLCPARAKNEPQRDGALARRAFCGLGVATYAAMALFVEVKYALPLQRQLGLELTDNAQAWVDENPEVDVVFTHSQGILLNYDVFEFERWQYPNNVVLVGGYEQYTAAWGAYLEQRSFSLDGYFMNLLDSEDFVSVSSEAQAQMMVTYLSEHAGLEVKAEQVANLGAGTQTDGNIYVWRNVSVQESLSGD